jgi:hypothetical protein
VNLFFDIETIPCQWPGILDEFAADVTAPGQYKKPDSIAAWLAENRQAEAEAAWLKTSFDGGMGQICVIGCAVDEHEPWTMQVADLSAASEADLLSTWFAWMTTHHTGNHGTLPVLIGHNHIAFDIPFIWKRAMVHGIRPPMWLPRNPKPWSDTVQDTMLLWDSQQRAGASMERICRILGIPGKGDMDGSKVWPMVRDGRIDEVAEYCKQDVERTRDMYRRMTFAQAA